MPESDLDRYERLGYNAYRETGRDPVRTRFYMWMYWMEKAKLFPDTHYEWKEYLKVYADKLRAELYPDLEGKCS